MKVSEYLADFDSATAFLRALGRFLHGKDFPTVGAIRWARPTWLGDAVSALPDRWRKRVYTFSGGMEAVSPKRLHQVRAEQLAQWVCERFPDRRYPAIAVGSSSGALMHLYAALGIPWLPQTFLFPVRSRVHPDDVRGALAYGEEIAGPLLKANAELQLHHMHDPAQDRLMLQRMTYFRVKRLRLGAAYAQFIRKSVPPGGTIFVVECRRAWPVVRVGPRHLFQFGALGGPTAEEFHDGSERISRYLHEQGASVESWDAPKPTEPGPEAEWGFAPELLEDVELFARRHGYKVARIVFDEPEDPSALVADLYAWWYRLRRIEPVRLIIESFVQVDPYWVLRTGSVPFWLKFNMEDDADRLEAFLAERGGFDHLHLTLFQHGVDGPGLASADRWRELLERARVKGAFLGVDPARHPRDFAAFVRYHTAMRALPPRHPLPGPLSLSQLERFLADEGGRHPVQWIAGQGVRRPSRAEAVALPV